MLCRIFARFAAGLAVTMPLPGSVAQQSVPPGWSPELGAVMQAYDAGDYGTTLRECTRILSMARDPHLRRDAAALEALAMLRSPARAEQMAGRLRLNELAAEDPALLRRPEVQLAWGVSLTATFETAAALRQLHEAVAAFAARGDEQRWQSACVALAACWARHSEWGDTPPELRVRPPGSSAEAQRVRREQIEAIRRGLERTPGAAPGLEEVNLILARLLMEAEDTRTEGLALLERLAAAGPSAASVAACLALAAVYEQEHRWEDALTLHVRAASGPDARLAAQARKAADAIRRPRLELEAPSMVSPGQPVQVGLRCRNVGRVELEIRRVDLAGWLAARRGMFSEAALPLDGSVAAARRLEPRMERPHDWWESGEGGALTATLSPGAYVLVGRAEGAGADGVSVRRLLLVSDLRAAVFVGRENIAIWATTEGREESDSGRAAARFWMHGSFVPQEVPLAAGTALLPLPPESRVLRDRGWTCLIEAGPHVALCCGQLAWEPDPARDTPRVILAVAPFNPCPGQSVRFLGLLREPGGEMAPAPGKDLRLELRDLREVVRLATPLDVTPAGTFLAELTIPTELAGQALNAVVLRGPHAIENVRGRLGVRVRSLDETPLLVRMNAARLSPPQGPPPVIEIAAAWPWGTPAAEAQASVHLRALRLPVPEPIASSGVPPVIEGRPGWVAAGPVKLRARLDNRGWARLVLPLGQIALPGTEERPSLPVAYSAHAAVYGPDGRGALGAVEFLRGDAAPAVWLTLDPGRGAARQRAAPEQSPAQPLGQFGLHWFDPGGTLIDEEVRGLVIRLGNLEPADQESPAVMEEVTRLPLFPAADGLRTDLWWLPRRVGQTLRPTEGIVEAVLPVREGKSVQIARTFRLPQFDGDAETPQVEARWTGSPDSPEISVAVTGGASGRRLLLCEADELLAVHPLEPEPAERHIRLSPRGGPASHAQVLLLRRGEDEGIRVERVVPVQESERRSVRLELTPAAMRVRPATLVRVRAECRTAEGRPAEAQLSARLVDLRGGHTLPWVPGEMRPALLPPASTAVSTGFRPLLEGAGWVERSAGVGWVERSETHQNSLESRTAGHGGEEAHTAGLWGAAASRPLVADPVPLPADLSAAMLERATVWVDSRQAVGGAVDFEIPIPPSAGLYRLWVIAQTRPDHVVIAAADLDARDGPSLLCDLPARMSVGDRTLAALTLTSGTEGTEATITVRSSSGLRLEPLRLASQEQARLEAVLPTVARVALRAAKPVTLLAPLEAVSPGEARVEFDVAVEGTIQRVAAAGMIHPPEAGPASEASQEHADPQTRARLRPIRVRRSLMLLSQMYTGGEESDAAADRAGSGREWVTSPLPPDGRLLPGQLLLVREEIELDEPLERVVWSQRLPPVWHTCVVAGDAFRPPGTPGVRRLDEVSWSTPRLRAGPFLYEYAVAAVRPGTALLPAPQVTVGGESRPVECTPADLRVMVIDPQR